MSVRDNLNVFNLVAAASLALFGLVALLYVIPEYVPVAGDFGQGLDARFMPTLAASALTALAAMLGASVGLRMRRGMPPLDEDNEDNEQQAFGARELANAVVLLAGSAVYVWLLEGLGFVVASALALMLCMRAGGVRSALVLAAVGLGLPIALERFVWYALTIRLPPLPFAG